jgi:hypothetical protein
MRERRMSTTHDLDSESLQPADGWLFPRCRCGWSFGPVPDMETFIDCLMAHAFDSALLHLEETR